MVSPRGSCQAQSMWPLLAPLAVFALGLVPMPPPDLSGRPASPSPPRAPQQAPSDPEFGGAHRQFDFWIGEWSVQNRHLQSDGTWREGDVTRARITPVCDGAAVLEEWAGEFRGSFMNGFSLRAFDPSTQRWDLLLFWTTTGDGGFGKLSGTFRHGRGEFFAGGAQSVQRYTFSDGLPDSVRWDSATSTDGRQTWNTNWIMEFSRTAPAAEVTEERLFDVAWTEGSVSPHAEARRLDWMLGTWVGQQTDALGGSELEARLHCKLLNKDCLVLDSLQVRATGATDWSKRVCVRGFTSAVESWESWRVSEDDTRLLRSRGTPGEEVATFEGLDPLTQSTTREVLRRLGPDELVIEEYLRAPRGTEFEPLRFTELRRAADGER